MINTRIRIILIIVFAVIYAKPCVLFANMPYNNQEQDPVESARSVIARTYVYWNFLGYSTAVARFTIGTDVAMYGGGYLLLESPKLAYEMAKAGFYGVAGSISKDVLLNIIESSVKTPRKLCKSISRSINMEGLKDYQISYDIARKYVKTETLSREEAISFLEHRWGLYKIGLARNLYNASNGPEETINDDFSKTVISELNSQIGRKLQKEVGTGNTVPIGEAAFLIVDIIKILELKKAGLSQYRPYIEFTENMEKLNALILQEKNQFQTGDNLFEAEKNILQNSTYQFSNGFLTKLVNGEWDEQEPFRRFGNLESIFKTNFTGRDNEYTLVFFGNWTGAVGGGPTIASSYELIVLELVDKKSIRQIFSIPSGWVPSIEEKFIMCIDADWEESDALCCPTREVRKYYKWYGNNFILYKQDKSEHSNN